MRRRLLPFLSAAVSSVLIVGFGAELRFHLPMRTFVGSVPGAAVAQEKRTEEKKSEMKSDTKPDTKWDAKMKKDKKTVTKSASGTVKSASDDSLVVSGKMMGDDEEWTFGVDPGTTIKKGSKVITGVDVKPGDSVQVKYTEDAGKMRAQSVTVKAASAKKAEKRDDSASPWTTKPSGPKEPEPGRPAVTPGARP